MPADQDDPLRAPPPPLPPVELQHAFEAALHSEATEEPGTRIGNYKLLQKIGEGGFGVVWMAEQEEPVRRRVALKVIKPGMDTREVIARFEAERQALALMDHPNIAHVFDAGATAGGRPFFVMELVRGVPITRYCDENRLSPEARLRLFVPVCQAVQHAHQKGVIHRDLKPSNILVTLHDGVPVPKIIDFGIAKAMQGRLTDKTLFTQFHAFVGTPVYTSPEQMEMSGLDVDTRSDIYGLGVLLYELLAGRPPFDPDALAKSGLEAMRRTIREVDPPCPSYRLGTLSAADRTSVAHQRGTEVTKLALLLRGDVDWIVMHCLEKDRTRRYDTAAALAADIQHHLRSEPITARPPSELYRMGKFVRRHRVGVAAVAAIALSLVGGLITASTLWVRERAARQQAVAARERAVVAEQSETRLRQQAETTRTVEAKRASRTSQGLAEKLLQEGRTPEGLAHLVRAARSDPENYAVGPRLIAALAYRSFAEPVGEPITGARYAGYCKDGRHFWTAEAGGVVHVWELQSGKPFHSFTAGEGSAMAESPDSRCWAIGKVDGTVTVWNTETGLAVLGPLQHGGIVGTIAFSPDGRWLGSASSDRTARIWDAATGELKAVLQHEHNLTSVAFSPDSTRMLTTTLHGGWRIWRVPDGEPIIPMKSVYINPHQILFNPDGTMVVVCDESGAQLYSANTGAAVGTWLETRFAVASVSAAFSRDGKMLATGSVDATARLWAVPSGKPLLPPLEHGGAVRYACFTPDSRYLVTRSLDGAARVWEVKTGRLAFEPIQVGGVDDIDLAPDGSEFLTIGRDGAVHRWRVAPGAVRPLQLPLGPSRIDVRPDANGAPTAWALYRDRMQRIDLLTGRALGSPRRFPAGVSVAVLAPDAHCLAVVTDTGESELWDLRSAEVTRHPLGQPLFRVWGALLFSPDSSRLAVVDRANVLRVWATDTGALVAGPIEQAWRRIAFSPDGRQLAVPSQAENTATIWDLATGSRVGEPLRHLGTGTVLSVQFSPDGKLVATGSGDGTVQLWDARTTQPIGPPLPHRSPVRGVAFTRDGRRLLSWTPLETRMWDVATGAPLTEPMAGENDVIGAALSQDDTRIATATQGGNVRIWGSASGQLLADPIRLMERTAEYPIPFFLSSGQFLAVPTATGRFFMWPMPPQSHHQPVPEWLLRLATVLAGGEIDARAAFREQAFDAKAFDEIRRELAVLPADAPYAEWGRWILADRATRPIGPGFKITAAEADKLAADLTAPSTPDR